MVRGIRGATTAAGDEASEILRATEELLREIVARNELEPESVASALFTVTRDLTAEFPAAAARRMGWTLVPLLNFTEIDVPGRLARCIRVLIHVNTDRAQDEIVHVYLGEARVLRPDLAPPPPALET
jgi:monofunctional chorismate mutase